MHLEAILTVGWPEPPEGSLTAAGVIAAARPADNGFQDRLKDTLESAPQPPVILALERSFRRRPHGFDDLKGLIGGLGSLPGEGTLRCEIDCFAYAFLKGAKNIDLLLPEAEEHGPFRRIEGEWADAIIELEDLERLGKPLRAADPATEEHYLRLRNILARKSARDERRSLASLLVTGPATVDELAEDLGLNTSLSQRVLAAFAGIDIVESRPGNRYVIREDKLPLVLFCLRETIGVDPLKALQPAEV